MEKIALITGASKGIGKALAEEYAKNGYSLLLIARTTQELEQLQKSVKEQYQCESKILSADLSNPAGVDAILRTFKDELGNVEVLVNNAGFGAVKKFSKMSHEDVSGMLSVNITSLTNLTYAILPFMLAKKRGCILNVASTAAFCPGPYMSLYYASKAFVVSFSEGLYEEFKSDGVTVSVLCPGLTDTHFHERSGTNKTHLLTMMPSMSAKKVAEIAYNGVQRKSRVIVPGLINKMLIFIMWMTPSFLAAKLTARLEKPKEA